jgi:CRP-like cAMP-binding protein
MCVSAQTERKRRRTLHHWKEEKCARAVSMGCCSGHQLCWVLTRWFYRLPWRVVVAPTQRSPVVNRLLEALPESDLGRMLAGCERVELAFGDVLYTPKQRLSHVYFPISSFIVLIMPVDGSASLEVGLIGCEGMFGIPLVLGVDRSPVRAVVIGAGAALRMDAALFCRDLGRRQALRRAIDRYVFVHLSELEQAAACTRFHVVEARLARWLLMTQDRAHAKTFHITQELMALMLGVRRVGVTKAASSLQKRGLIHYNRGDVTVLDRRGLQAASCGCYKADRESYDRIFGKSFRGAGHRPAAPP